MKTIAALLMLIVLTPLHAAKPIVIGGSGADLETFRILSLAFQGEHPEISFDVMPSIGSGGAVRGVASGRVDLGLMSRPIKAKEKKHQLTEIHYADTALVFVTHQEQGLSDINLQTLRDIYLGNKTAANLKPILRPKSDSDTSILFKKLPDFSAALQAAYRRKGLPVAMTDQLTIKMALETNNVITTSTLSIIATEKPALKILSLNGISPSNETLSNGQYPLKKSLYLIHNRLINQHEQQFIDFVLSEKGQRILSETGHFIAQR